MTLVYTDFNYLEIDYTREEYLSAQRAGALGFQFQVVVSGTTPTATQFETHIVEQPAPAPAQVEAHIDAAVPGAAQLLASIQAVVASGAQLRGLVVDFVTPAGAQFETRVESWPQSTGAQFEASISSGRQTSATQFRGTLRKTPATGSQFEAHIQQKPQALGSRFTKGKLFHSWQRHDIYTVDSYLTETYLTRFFTAHQNAQFEARVDRSLQKVATQFVSIIKRQRLQGAQFEAIIAKSEADAAQFNIVTGKGFGAQFRIALYNTTQLRILWEFPSRGNGSNWTANTTASGDFSANNLNTDVVEQVWRSNPGAKTGIRLDCDTGLPQGVFLDTFAMLGHNLTRSASVVVQGSNNSDFSGAGISFTITDLREENSFYIAPELPNMGYRYWRVAIDDATNPADYLQIGGIVFGNATIFTTAESFSNPIQFRRRHYLDTIETEGFTTVGNDRGIKRSFTLNFQSLNFAGGNYAALREIFDSIRTSHKALWIPTPQYPGRYAVFGKLVQLPEETHTDNGEDADYVDLSLEVDEAK